MIAGKRGSGANSLSGVCHIYAPTRWDHTGSRSTRPVVVDGTLRPGRLPGLDPFEGVVRVELEPDRVFIIEYVEVERTIVPAEVFERSGTGRRVSVMIYLATDP